MGGVQSRANTPPHPKEMAGFGLLGQVFQLGMSYLDEAPEQTQDRHTDYIYQLVWVQLDVSLDKVEEVARGKSGSSCCCPCNLTSGKQKNWMMSYCFVILYFHFY